MSETMKLKTNYNLWQKHFCSALTIAREFGLYHHQCFEMKTMIFYCLQTKELGSAYSLWGVLSSGHKNDHQCRRFDQMFLVPADWFFVDALSHCLKMGDYDYPVAILETSPWVATTRQSFLWNHSSLFSYSHICLLKLPCWLPASDRFLLLRVLPNSRVFQHTAKLNSGITARLDLPATPSGARYWHNRVFNLFSHLNIWNCLKIKNCKLKILLHQQQSIPFATHAFVFQCQEWPNVLPSLLVFPMISTDFTPTPWVPYIPAIL